MQQSLMANYSELLITTSFYPPNVPALLLPQLPRPHRLLAADINFTWDQEWGPPPSLHLPAIRLGKNGCMFVALEGVATEKIQKIIDPM